MSKQNLIKFTSLVLLSQTLTSLNRFYFFRRKEEKQNGAPRTECHDYGEVGTMRKFLLGSLSSGGDFTLAYSAHTYYFLQQNNRHPTSETTVDP